MYVSFYLSSVVAICKCNLGAAVTDQPSRIGILIIASTASSMRRSSYSTFIITLRQSRFCIVITDYSARIRRSGRRTAILIASSSRNCSCIIAVHDAGATFNITSYSTRIRSIIVRGRRHCTSVVTICNIRTTTSDITYNSARMRFKIRGRISNSSRHAPSIVTSYNTR